MGHWRRSAASAAPDEQGSAVVDFVLVGTLLTLLFLSIIQFTLVLHVRNTLIDAAASGARYGSLADRTPTDAKERASELIGSALSADFPREVTAAEATTDGLRTMEVTVRAPFPMLGLIGPVGLMEVKGHAVLPG
ncbi:MULTISPECIES: TadE/TadG family type IV pilus assembly protein [Micrococcaceae]|uniref:TadE/TadG family type IV pilus assembly protein n=1 Tax=Micrococcaceae TaxID=1268 RepID=UPI0021481A9E|nr:TadE/TadG family type IV pilus assembly protein [Paenarthrobacter sp. UW852]MCR1161288.1 pilus assembly protein [Paenarthrobacter sp. UW852]